MLHFTESSAGILHQMNSCKSQAVNMLEYVSEGNDSGPSLRRIEPVSLPWISNHVRLAAVPNKDSIQCVVKDRNVDQSPLQEWHEGKGIQKLDLSRIGMRSICGISVRDKVLDQERADRHDTAERMQPAKQK